MTVTLEPEVKERLAQLADERESNLNDVGVAILAERFDFTYEPTGIRSSGVGPSERVCFEMPLALRDRVNDRLTSENRSRRRRGEARLNQGSFLNAVLRDYLDAQPSAA